MYANRQIWFPCGKDAAQLEMLCSSIHPGAYDLLYDLLHFLMAQKVTYFAHFAHAYHCWVHHAYHTSDRFAQFPHVNFEPLMPRSFPVDVNKHHVGRRFLHFDCKHLVVFAL